MNNKENRVNCNLIGICTFYTFGGVGGGGGSCYVRLRKEKEIKTNRHA